MLMSEVAMNQIIEWARWTWLVSTFLAFVVAECAGLYYLYRFLGWI